jgi:hypothetical protein
MTVRSLISQLQMMPPDALVVLESLVIHKVTGITVQDGLVRLSDLDANNRKAVLEFQTLEDLKRDLKAASQNRSATRPIPVR